MLSTVTLILFIKPLIALNALINEQNNLATIKMDVVVSNSVQTIQKDTVGNDTPQITRQMSKSCCPTIQISTETSSRNICKKGNKDSDLQNLIVRYALLVIIAVVSSFAFHAVAIKWNWVAKHLSPVDDFIN